MFHVILKVVNWFSLQIIIIFASFRKTRMTSKFSVICVVFMQMTDVSQGGATVFPRLQLVVTPKKGTALFWMNVLPSGELDERMLHGACPVLYGCKWGTSFYPTQIVNLCRINEQ